MTMSGVASAWGPSAPAAPGAGGIEPAVPTDAAASGFELLLAGAQAEAPATDAPAPRDDDASGHHHRADPTGDDVTGDNVTGDRATAGADGDTFDNTESATTSSTIICPFRETRSRIAVCSKIYLSDRAHTYHPRR